MARTKTKRAGAKRRGGAAVAKAAKAVKASTSRVAKAPTSPIAKAAASRPTKAASPAHRAKFGSHMKKVAAAHAAPPHHAHSAHAAHETSTLPSLVGGLLAGRIRVVDLTQTLTPEFPAIALPPEFGQCAPFRMEEISRYDERGPAWYWNNFTCGEHTGTHFDAPIHWVSGRDLPNNATDTVPVQQLVGAACVVDCTREAAADADYLLTVEKLLEWERRHGRIPARSWVLMRTDWSKRAIDPVAYQNFDATGQHTPGPSTDAVRFLVDERDVIGFGTEAIGTDAGQAYHLQPPYPCHSLMHGAGRYGLQCLTNLDLLPPTGAVIFAAPLKIRNGSGSPLRVLALVEAR